MIGDSFTPEAHAELLAMYTGMAMQGLIVQLAHTPDDKAPSDEQLADNAVKIASQTIGALERHHQLRAEGQAAIRKAVALSVVSGGGRTSPEAVAAAEAQARNELPGTLDEIKGEGYAN